jgi:hypothetical protein
VYLFYTVLNFGSWIFDLGTFEVKATSSIISFNMTLEMKPFEGVIVMYNAKYFPAATTEGGT